MATSIGPDITTDNLVFGYDTGYPIVDNDNSSRFSKGEATENLIYDMGGAVTSAYPQVVYRCTANETNVVDTSVPGGKYSRFTGVDGSSNNQLYSRFSSYSIDVRGESVNYSVYLKGSGTCHLTIYDNQSGYGTSSTITLTSNWVRYNYTRTINASATSYWVAVRGVLNTTDVYIAGQQAIRGTHSTPYVEDNRSSTQSLIDLKETTDISTSNVSFDSNAQMTFDGTDDEIELAANDWNKVTAVTVEAIVSINGAPIDSNDYHVVVQKDGAYSGGAVYGIRINNSSLPYGTFSKGSSSSDTHVNTVAGNTMASNKYYHLVYTRQVGESIFYQNGAEVTKNTSNNDSIYNNTDTVTIGQGDGRQLYGDIPVVKIHNRVLSAEEVTQNYNAYKKRFGI